MKLDELGNYKKDLGRTRLVFGILGIVAVLSAPLMYYMNLDYVDRKMRQRLVIDRDNRQFIATDRKLSPQERQAQYIRHAEDFWELMWENDAASIEQRVNAALELAGSSAEQKYKEYYIEKGLERKIREENWRTKVQIERIDVRTDTIPHVGIIYSRWTITRPGGSTVRNLNATFSMEDVSISKKNPLGARVEDIDIFNNTRVSGDD